METKKVKMEFSMKRMSRLYQAQQQKEINLAIPSILHLGVVIESNRSLILSSVSERISVRRRDE